MRLNLPRRRMLQLTAPALAGIFVLTCAISPSYAEPVATSSHQRIANDIYLAVDASQGASTGYGEDTRPSSFTQPIGAQIVPTPTVVTQRKPVVVNGQLYDAYLQAATKKKQDFQYSCEFDAAWVILKSYGFDVSVARQAEIVGVDKSREPYFKQTKQGLIIYGGDVTRAFSGDYKKNFLARSTGAAMRKVFEHYGLQVTPVRDRAGVEAALLRGELIWIKTTVDFKAWRPATWVMPDGRSYKTVLGNDHAAVVMGFNRSGVVIRDVLGPTSTNRKRAYEYEVAWPRFLAAWGAQGFDGLAVGKSTP